MGAAITKSKNEQFVDRGIQDTSISRDQYQSLCKLFPLNTQVIIIGMSGAFMGKPWHHLKVFV